MFYEFLRITPLYLLNPQTLQMLIRPVVMRRQAGAVLPKSAGRFVDVVSRNTNHHAGPSTRQQHAFTIGIQHANAILLSRKKSISYFVEKINLFAFTVVTLTLYNFFSVLYNNIKQGGDNHGN